MLKSIHWTKTFSDGLKALFIRSFSLASGFGEQQKLHPIFEVPHLYQCDIHDFIHIIYVISILLKEKHLLFFPDMRPNSQHPNIRQQQQRKTKPQGHRPWVWAVAPLESPSLPRPPWDVGSAAAPAAPHSPGARSRGDRALKVSNKWEVDIH